MFIKTNKSISNLLKSELSKANEINVKKDLPNNNYINLKKSYNKVEITLLQTNSSIGKFDIVDFPKLSALFKFKDSFVAEFNEVKEELNVVTHVDLHCHTGYSLLDGMNKVKDLSEKTVYSRAITDHGVMYGCVDFYKTMKKSHKKAIIGFEAYTETFDGDYRKRHLVLLAKNEQGYKNISMLSTLGNSNYGGKFPYRPIVKYEWLRKYSEGVVCLTACLGGEIQQNFLKGEDEKAKLVAKELHSIYGDDFYMEIQRHNIEKEIKLNEQLINLAHEMGVKIVATSDAHYLNKEDSKVHEIHLCNQTKTTLDNPNRYKFPGEDYHVHTIEEMEAKFRDIPEALFNTLEVMEKCDFSFDFGNYKMPKFPVPEGMTEATYLEELAWRGFDERFPVGTTLNGSKEYRDRMKFELGVIQNMGYDAYFLIVWDFLNYSKSKGYPVGPGRGSACGSLVSFCLKITEIDPIPYGLLFERFLNPDRKSMPDCNIVAQ